MITPKVKEIETRFSAGEGLSSEDINTLLLKSQYNHINHLDQKLDQVTDSVIELEKSFCILKIDSNDLKKKWNRPEKNSTPAWMALKKTLRKISEAINTNMRWSIGMIALIVTVLKLADMFVK